MRWEIKIAMDEWTRTVVINADSLEEAKEIGSWRASNVCGILTSVEPIESPQS